MEKQLGIYMNQCPNCGGPISDARLNKGLVCEKCLPKVDREVTPKELLLLLYRKGSLKELKSRYEIEKETDNFMDLFEKAVGWPPWSSQITWAKRVLQGTSFSIIAPTGVGKTVFGLIMALYQAKKGSKSYLVFPTTPLVLQMCEKLKSFNEKVRAVKDEEIVCIHGNMKQSEKKEALQKIEEGKLKILLSTSKFMINRSNQLSSLGFYFLFVDDVDSVLKSKASIDATLKVMGFHDEDIENGIELIRLKRRMTYANGNASKREEQTLENLSKKLKEAKERVRSTLVVSSATGRSRGMRALLFRELLGFQIGGRTEIFRNVEDVYNEVTDKEIEEELYRIISLLGKGGLIYVPTDLGVEYAVKLTSWLKEKGIRAEAFYSKTSKVLEAFQKGEIDVLVGVAVYYGVMVRGLDLPTIIRYAVFIGPPKFRFSFDLTGAHPINIVKLLSAIAEANIPKVSERAKPLLLPLRRALRRLSPAALQLLASDSPVTGTLKEIQGELKKAKEFLKRTLEDNNVIEALKKTGEIFIEITPSGKFIIIPDAKTYIQASGRTSRLYAGGLTKGLAVTLITPKEIPVLKSLERILSFYTDKFSFKPISQTDLNEILKEIDNDRRKLIDALEGREASKLKELVKTALMIVESPNKARTISNFFGKPSVRILPNGARAYEISIGNLTLTITATEGHIVDLLPSASNEALEYSGLRNELYGVVYDLENKIFLPVYSTIKKCRECGYQFVEDTKTCPRCGSKNVVDKTDTIIALRNLVAEFDKILVATDPDSEGEKIGWDVAAVLRPLSNEIKRIEFHEVTRRAILDALKNERLLDEKLVTAQIVRRIEDRWIGFFLSKKLQTEFWKEYCSKKRLSNCGENRNLSAGRVQTPVLGWIIDRYNEYKKSTGFVVSVEAKVGKSTRQFEFIVKDPDLFVKLGQEKFLNINVLKEEKVKLNPPPPFTTDSLITEANRVFGFSAQEVMRLAQDLFELGLITYHRTDSTRISTLGIEIAKEYLRRVKGEELEKTFSPRTWGEGGAHEAIRPTKPFSREELRRLLEEGEIELVRTLTSKHFSLYDLIFRRFIASQMKPAEVLRQRVVLKFGEIIQEQEFITNIVSEPGFLEFYSNLRTEPPLSSGVFEVIDWKYYKKRLVPLYTEGEVVALMRERRIGRPSTYATIISKLHARKYVVESRKHGKLIPTELGINIFNYLNQKFRSMVSEERTRTLEAKMDDISEGKLEHSGVIAELYREIEAIGGMEEKRK
ncbi:MAG: reverse gyrase [Fervidicoccaceae archaeon]